MTNTVGQREKLEAACSCRNVEFGTYESYVELVPPPFLARPDGRGICVDACLALEITRLWKEGVITTGCCCGHNRLLPSITVRRDQVPKMLALGYQPWPDTPGVFDAFIAKSLAHPPSAGEEKTGEREALARASERLANAADSYGVAHLDSDDLDEDAEELQAATLALRAILALSPTSGGGTGPGPACPCGGVIEGWICQTCEREFEEVGGLLVPHGYTLVPVEPVREMWAAMGNAVVALQHRRVGNHDAICEAVWKAALSAAPSSPEVIGGGTDAG